jgi:hypothetical protein
MEHSPFAEVFTHGSRFAQQQGEPVEMSVHVVGELKVPTGRLCASDPFTTSFDEKHEGFARQTPTGVFPVEVAVARFPWGDQRVACARVRFGPPGVRAVRWEAALFEGQTLAEGDEPPAYGVDAGTGCFFDEAACAAIDQATTDAWLAATEKNYVSTWTWHVAEVGAANVVRFSSGGGDGLYSSYWGFDADGRLVELVTDFDVLYSALVEHAELPLPLPRGPVQHPFLQKHGLELVFKKPLFSRPRLFVGGKGLPRLALSDGTPIEVKTEEGVRYVTRYYTWREPAPGTRLVVSLTVSVKPLTPL